jgi:hypothetical protein
MYATAASYLGYQDSNEVDVNSFLMKQDAPSRMIRSDRVIKPAQYVKKESFVHKSARSEGGESHSPTTVPPESIQPEIIPPTLKPTPSVEQPTLQMTYKEEIVSTTSPKVWGPAKWLDFHISSLNYPENPSPIVRSMTKDRILAIPYELPCSECRKHASSYIDSKKDKLDKIVSSNENLFRFYVDFHNQVNYRHGKREWTYEEAKQAYSGKAAIKTLQYKATFEKDERSGQK